MWARAGPTSCDEPGRADEHQRAPTSTDEPRWPRLVRVVRKATPVVHEVVECGQEPGRQAATSRARPDKRRAVCNRPGRTEHLVCSTKMRPMRARTKADEPNESSLSMPPEGRKSSFRAGETTSFCLTCCFAYAKPLFFFFAGPQAEPGQARPRHVGKKKGKPCE